MNLGTSVEKLLGHLPHPLGTPRDLIAVLDSSHTLARLVPQAPVSFCLSLHNVWETCSAIMSDHLEMKEMLGNEDSKEQPSTHEGLELVGHAPASLPFGEQF